MKTFFALTILCLIFESGFTSAQPKLTFEHFGLEQGALPMIPCAFQDRTGYLWFGSYHGVFRFDGYSFKPFITLSEKSSKVTKAVVNVICDDSEGNIWIGHIQGLDKLNPYTEDVVHYILNPEVSITDKSNHVLSLLEDRNGNIWAGTGNGLYLLDKKKEKFVRILQDSSGSGRINNNAIYSIYETKDGMVWFGTSNGLNSYDKSSNKFSRYLSISNLNPHSILKIFEDRDGVIWLGTSGGLVEFNREDSTFKLYKHNPNDPSSLADNVVGAICEDLNGNLWLSSAGLDIFNKHTKKFSHHKYDESNSKSLSHDKVSDILFDRSGTMWITTYGGGINKYTLPNQFVKKYFLEKKVITNTGWGNLAEDNNGKIWIGTDKGLVSFDPVSEKFKDESLQKNVTGILLDKAGTLWINSRATGNLYFKKDKEESIQQFFFSNGKPFFEDVASMHNCKDGKIWIGTTDGKILKMNQDEKTIQQIAKYDNRIYTLYEDKAGFLWIGTFEGGVICYNPLKKTFERFYSDPNDSLTLSGNHIYGFCEDASGTLWAVAGVTSSKFDPGTRKWIRWGGKEGFPLDAFSLIDDAHGNLWISTVTGVFKYNPFTKKLLTYNDVKLGWGYRVKNGELYFVSTTFYSEKQSIMRVNPDNISNNNFIAPVSITSFKKFEKHTPFGKEIHLSHIENFISFEFAALSYANNDKNQYSYKMEGVDKDWVNSGTRRYASYPNLEPGEYIFKVKGSNSDGVWNEKGTSIKVIIYPPWWKTWWAYLTYTAIFLAGVYGVRRYEMNRMSLKNKVKMDEAVLKEREETDKLKSRFFANISHEFRTPLTLIIGPAEKILTDTSEDIKKDANIIKRNSRRLLQLINQLLDLSRLEAGRLKLETSCSNIVSFVKGVTLSFESLSESKDITLKLISEKEFIELYFDKEKMMKILTNILSNAFKFTPEEGIITVAIKEVNKKVEIKIKDTGIGIPAGELPKLFDRFYQVDSSHTREYEGSGIGLALTKELVDLHYGSIRVESVQNDAGNSWTEFTLEFLLGREHLKDEEILNEVQEIKEIEYLSPKDNLADISQNGSVPDEAPDLKEEKTIVLVVEDNYDMREYIKDSLNKKEYQVEEAVNGEQGIRKAEKFIPDLIVSDLMMPKMDGNQLVSILKNNEKTSHIPIILLTAKAGLDDKLEGLETGADDYLTKPFDIKELQIRIKNLISIRKKLQEKFSKSGFSIRPDGKKYKSVDERFMEKILKLIEEHISEEEFRVDDFCNETAMSRTQLHRKIKALTGKSTSLFIRSVKLNKAKSMVEQQYASISEIAYSLGFSSPTYFTKCYKEEFGYPPSAKIK